MFTSVGIAASGGVAAALLIGVSIIPTAIIQFRGDRWRGAPKNIAASDQEAAIDSNSGELKE